MLYALKTTRVNKLTLSEPSEHFYSDSEEMDWFFLRHIMYLILKRYYMKQMKVVLLNDNQNFHAWN